MKLSHLANEFSTHFHAFSMCHLLRCSSPTACIHSSGVSEPLDPVNNIHDPEANLNVHAVQHSVD